MMDGTFIEKLVEHLRPSTFEVDGKTFSDRRLVPVIHDPRPKPITAHTLQALKDYLGANVDGLEMKNLIAHVVNHQEVQLFGPAEKPLQERSYFLKCDLVETARFRFGEWHDPESFIINLLSLFEETEDLNQLLDLVGSLKAEAVTTLDDDRTTQVVTRRQGVALAKKEKAPLRMKLAPFRTFREIEQPPSMFIFRVRGGGEGELPQCALFEADGSAWMLDAIEAIAAWIRENIPGLNVIA